MFVSLRKKVVIVTGGSSGIGKALVKLLADYGMNVALLYNRNQVDLESLGQELKEDHGVIRQYQMDITSAESVSEVIGAVEKDFGNIHFLVNSAGIIADSLMALMKDEDYERVIDTNLTGNYRVMKAVLPYMLVNGKGAIVNITSISGLKGVAGQTNYCASKFGVIGMTRALASELAAKEIRINAVAPGYIETEMTQNVKNLSQKVRGIPMRRMGKPEEIGNIVLFLLSDGAGYITGETIVADGGMLA